MKPRVLVVDDEEACAPVVKALSATGCRVKSAPTGEKAVGLMTAFKPEILITEIELPGISGFALLELIQNDPAVKSTRTLVVTSDLRGKTLAKAFEKGAEDFLVKPFDIRELVTRVKVILRRLYPNVESDRIRWGKLSLEPATRKGYLDDADLKLTKIEFGMLQLFIQKAGRVLSRSFLLQYLWGASATGQTRTVDMHVANLRKKLGPEGDKIETIKGIGYLLPRA